MGKDDKSSEGKGGAAEVVKALPAEVMKRVEALSELQAKFLEQNKAYVAEYKELQKKYHGIYSELWTKRSAIVNGQVDPAGAAEGATKGIEGFWLQALQNGRRTGPTIEEHDEPALKTLTDITLEYLEDFQGFRLVFHFGANDYFSDEKLTKTFHIPHMMGGGRLGSDPTIEKLEGCEIHWKAGKNLTEKEVKKTTKKKGKKVTQVKKEPQESFFRFFDTPDMEDDTNDLEPEEVYELQEQISMEMEVGFEIKNKIIPRAVDWFTGEAVADESSDEEDEDYEGEDDDEDYDEEDDEEEEEEEKPKKGGKGSAARGKKGKKDADEDEDDEEGDDEDREKMAAALAQAFAKSLSAKGGKGSGKKGKKGKDEDEDDEEEGDAKAPSSGAKGAEGEKPPECKQQ